LTLATARRVLWQIRRDPRTLALLLVVPVALLALMHYVYEGKPHTFQAIGAPMCGLFPFIIMFLITSIAMLRERTNGTLERLMALPIAKVDLLVGYGIAFGLLAALQAVVVCVVGFLALGLVAPHGTWLLGLLAVGNAILGMALGLFVSAFARTEFQAVQFMPAVIYPQLLLCGLFIDRHEMAAPLFRSPARCRSPTPTTPSHARPAHVRSAARWRWMSSSSSARRSSRSHWGRLPCGAGRRDIASVGQGTRKRYGGDRYRRRALQRLAGDQARPAGILSGFHVGVLSWSSVSRYGARYFAAIFVGGDQVGVSVICELNP